MHKTFLLTNIKGIWLPLDEVYRPVRGKDMSRSNILEDAFIWVKNGLIEAFGKMEFLSDDLPDGLLESMHQVDCKGKYVLPSFVDAHSHLVFAAWREGEMELRLKGKSYLEIAEAGGGILNSARRLEQTSEILLFDQAFQRLESLIKSGTGALEIKSGYGLTLESEMKMLRVIKKIKEESPIPIKSTFLGAHAIPKSYSNRNDYIDLLINEMIPAVASEGLADYCDVFCDTGFFTQHETELIL
jgi:imidazolonepropionase